MGNVELYVRNSERGTLNKCPQRWWWNWREGLAPKETPKALWFGSAIHAALADFYRPGTKRSKKFIDVFRNFADMEAEYMRVHIGSIDEDKFIEARVLGETMLNGYLAEYGGDKDWDVIATEQAFQVELPFFQGRNDINSPLVKKILKKYGETFILSGTFDGVYRSKSDNRVRLMEHKTAGSISVGHLPMDNQAGTYWMVAQLVGRTQGWLGPNENIAGIMYNFLRKAIPDDRPRDAQGYCTNNPTKVHYEEAFAPYVDKIDWPRLKKDRTSDWYRETAASLGIVVLGERSKSQPPKLFERHPVKRTPKQRQMQLHRLQDEVLRMVAYREGWLPLTKSPSRDTCPMCPFKDMCELHESGGDWTGYRDVMFRSADPYIDHRKDAGAA